MAKRVIVIIVVALVLVGATSYAYSHYRDRRMEAGEVVDESGAAVGSSGGQVKSAKSLDTRDDGSDDGSARPAKHTTYPTSTSLPVTPVQTSVSTAPATDTISPNPPNGTVFAGTGKFQVYRQGDLTWRVNTADGSTCILFATEEQWRKPLVYRNGCRRS